MEQQEHQPFDLESVYDNEISPLMSQIIEICNRHKMPMLATFMYQHLHGESEDDSYCTTFLGGENDWKPARISKAFQIIRSERAFSAFTVTVEK